MPTMAKKRLASALFKPFTAFAISGMYLVYKYSQYKRQQQEATRRKVTEKELQNLNSKIDRLLAHIEDGETDVTLSQDEECVVCLAAKATMQTFPCGHKVVCRKCFIKTIQVAVTQRSLPLTCVVCRTKILKLKQSGEESASSSSKRHSGSGQGSSSRKLSGPAQLARQLLMGGGSHHHARHPPQTPPSSKNFHDGHPVVATKIMKPLLIYPSQTSPKQQHAFSTDGDRSSANHRPTSTPQRNTAARPSHSHYKDSPKRAQRPLVSCTDSPIMSGRGWADKHSCQHSHKLDSKYTHLLSPRVTSRCSHCAPNDKVAHNQVVKQGV